MLTLDAKKFTASALLVAGAKADTAAATSAWTAITDYDGPIIIIANCGTVTAGQLASKIQSATANDGTGAADVVSFTTVTTSNDPLIQSVVLDARTLPPFIAFVGTVTTGPVDLSVTMLAAVPTAG